MKKVEHLVLIVLLLASFLAAAEPGYVVRPVELMDEPYRDANVVITLEEGASVDIVERKGGWLKVNLNDNSGWARMSSIRKGDNTPQPDAGTEAKGVLDFASGRAGTGNVVSATGVRGLNEEELREAKFNAVEIEKMESLSVDRKAARNFAKKANLKTVQVDFLSAPGE